MNNKFKVCQEPHGESTCFVKYCNYFISTYSSRSTNVFFCCCCSFKNCSAFLLKWLRFPANTWTLVFAEEKQPRSLNAGSRAPWQLLGNGPHWAPYMTRISPPDKGRRVLLGCVVKANAHARTHRYALAAQWPDKHAAARPITRQMWQTCTAERRRINSRLREVATSLPAERSGHHSVTRPQISECAGFVTREPEKETLFSSLPCPQMSQASVNVQITDW